MKYNSETIYDLTAFEETTVGISPTNSDLEGIFHIFCFFTDAMRYLRDRLFIRSSCCPPSGVLHDGMFLLFEKKR